MSQVASVVGEVTQITTGIARNYSWVVTRHASTARWTVSYLGSWWPETGEHRPQAGQLVGSVEGIVDDARYDAVADVVREAPEPVTTFLRVPGARRRVSGVVHAWCPDREVAYVHDPGTGNTMVVGGDERQVMLDTSRIARNLVVDALERAGWTMMHAACVVAPGGGVLIVGHRGAGKTTTSLTLAQVDGHALLANDRCLLRADAEGIAVLAWPGSISVGFGLLAALGWSEKASAAVRANEPQHPFQHPDVAGHLRAGDYTPRFGTDGRELKYEVLPDTLTARFGVSLAHTARVTEVWFPAVSKTPGSAPRRIAVDEAAIAEHTLTGSATGYPNFLDHRGPPAPGEHSGTAALLRRLVKQPSYEIVLGRDVAANRKLLADR